jgi:hypothetical protein
MHMVKPVRVLWALGIAVVGLLPLTGIASANVNDVSTERGGSIIVFPKVVWDGTRDTIIQIGNLSNSMVHAHCFYVNAAPVNPSLPPSSSNPPQWNETDFDIWLTRQQPTHWVASLGRRWGNLSGLDGNNNAGLSPGLVPPVPQGFIGELKCVQVDESGNPLRANALKGEATLRNLAGDVSEYNAVAFQGNPDMTASDPRSADQSSDLVLDLTTATASDTGDNSGMYSACPDTLLLNHFAELSPDMVIDQIGTCERVCVAGPSVGTLCTASSDCGIGGLCGSCPVSTELTLVPCQEDFENQQGAAVTVQFLIINEFEQAFSTSTTVSCYMNLPLGLIGTAGNNSFTYTVLGTLSAYSRITPATGNGGVIGVAEEFRGATMDSGSGFGPKTAAAFNLETEGNRFDAATNGKGDSRPGVTDHIIIPLP